MNTHEKANLQKTVYVVRVSSANMPGSCWGKYAHVAVMEVAPGTMPTMISERAKGVVRIVRAWRSRNVGTTERCAFRRALAEANELAAKLNNTL